MPTFFSKVANYVSLVKFSHTVFAMPFGLIGLFLGFRDSVGFSWWLLLLALLCMVFARNAAMGFNRYLDRDIDAKNPRTKNREVPKGIISPKSALTFVIVNSILFCATAFFINRLAFFLSPVALLVILGYSYTKRFTSLCHFVLGLGLAIAPAGAYIAITGSLTWVICLYSLMVLLWVSGFDILYSLQDEGFDKQESLSSIPALIGCNRAMILSSVLHVIVACIVVLLGVSQAYGIWFWIGAAFFMFMLLYQHLIISPTKLDRINAAFALTNGVASVLFATFHIIDILV